MSIFKAVKFSIELRKHVTASCLSAWSTSHGVYRYLPDRVNCSEKNGFTCVLMKIIKIQYKDELRFNYFNHIY